MAQNRANLPPAGRQSLRGDQLCKTNPIPAAGADRAKQTRFGLAWTRLERGRPKDAKQTQFGGRRAGANRTDRAKQSQSVPGQGRRWGQSCKTNPIPGVGADRGKQTRFPVSRAAGNPRLCETKPIHPRAPKIGRGRPGSNCAKRSQFHRTDREGQALCGKGVMVNWTRRRRRRNEPNSPMRPEMDAGRRSCCRSKMRKTNPIYRRGAGKTIAKAPGLDAATRPGANAPNKPNLPRIGPKGAGRRGPQGTRRRG